MKTPWFDMKFIENAYKISRRIFIECKDLAIAVTSMLGGKERAFFVAEHNVDTMKDIFYIRDNEEMILATDDKSIDELISKMKESQDKKFYFILAKYESAKGKLIAAGFSENKDFIDATLLLSNKHGYNLPIYPLLKYL